MIDSQITSPEFKKLFNSKKRLWCASCGNTEFELHPTMMPNTTIDEAVFMVCKDCGHERLEMV